MNDGGSRTELGSKLLDGITLASIVTVLAYAAVVTYVTGYYSYFVVPFGDVSTDFLAVYEVINSFPAAIYRDPWLLATETSLTIGLLLVPRAVYKRNGTALIVLVIMLWFSAAIYRPWFLAGFAGVCFILIDSVNRRRHTAQNWIARRIGDKMMKFAIVCGFLVMPLYYAGYSRAHSGRAFYVLNYGHAEWLVLRRVQDKLILVRLLNPVERSQAVQARSFRGECQYLYRDENPPASKKKRRPVSRDGGAVRTPRMMAAREYRILKEDEAPMSLRKTLPVDVCRFATEHNAVFYNVLLPDWMTLL